MTLITSISGIRGTIGGKPGEGLTPIDIVKFTSAFAEWIKQNTSKSNPRIVLGRDARISGEMVDQLVSGTLMGMGVNVINLSLATTPTVEIAVTELNADGGIIITASHNPKHWNALKLLNNKGEFLSKADGEAILNLVRHSDFNYSEVDELGKISQNLEMNDIHIQKVLDMPLVHTEKIKEANFKVAIDCVNSVGGIILPALLKKLGVSEVIELYCNPDGIFPHNPEPLPENLTEISKLVKNGNANLGFVVDPDVDRLAIVCEDGSMFGEEYTLVAVADYILSELPGSTCSNLSSSRALRQVTEKHGQQYVASAVGEVNVVQKMKEENCVIGGEGNGGIIYPGLHYGRDALAGMALFLTFLAKKGMRCSELRQEYPNMEMVKNKISLLPGTNVDHLLRSLENVYRAENITTIDGLKIDFDHGWVHLRKSNTEPIIRVYSEAGSREEALNLVSGIMTEVDKILN